MRLNKAKKDEYKKLIKDSDGKKLITISETQGVKWAWRELSFDHYSRLRLDLQHIAEHSMKDKLESDVMQDGARIFDTQSYFSHYSSDELKKTLRRIREAENGLKYLSNLAMAEIERRERMKS